MKHEEVKRFEDKTEEEVAEDMKKKKRQHMNRLVRYRTRQFAFIFGGFFLYLVVYRRIAPKPVMNSIVYHQALGFVQGSTRARQLVGEQF